MGPRAQRLRGQLILKRPKHHSPPLRSLPTQPLWTSQRPLPLGRSGPCVNHHLLLFRCILFFTFTCVYSAKLSPAPPQGLVDHRSVMSSAQQRAAS